MDEVYIKVNDLNKWVSKYFKDKDIVSIDELVGTIEDLDDEIERLKEKIEDMEQDIQENYKPIPASEQVGVSDRDFI